MPFVIQLGHHHEEPFVCKAENEQHIHVQHKSCADFHYKISLFSIDFIAYKTVLTNWFFEFYTIDLPIIFLQVSHYFSLRAPPAIM